MAAPICRIALFTPIDISHDAFRRYFCGSAFHTLYGSGAPMLPPVVTFTRSPDTALIAVRMPFGSFVPDPMVNFCTSSSSYPWASRVDISDANDG